MHGDTKNGKNIIKVSCWWQNECGLNSWPCLCTRVFHHQYYNVNDHVKTGFLATESKRYRTDGIYTLT